MERKQQIKQEYPHLYQHVSYIIYHQIRVGDFCFLHLLLKVDLVFNNIRPQSTILFFLEIFLKISVFLTPICQNFKHLCFKILMKLKCYKVLK